MSEQEELSAEFIDKLIAELLGFGYVNEERFAENIYSSWLNGSHKGKYYLINKLNKHKIKQEIVSKYQDTDLTEIELNRAVELIQKYLVIKKISVVEARNKIAVYLKNQYYAPDIINRAINIMTNISK